MVRKHKSLKAKRRVNKIDVDEVAFAAEDHLELLKSVAKHTRGIPGLFSPTRIKNTVKRIDELEKEAIKLEEKIEALWLRRAQMAVDLEDMLLTNQDIISAYVVNPFEV